LATINERQWQGRVLQWTSELLKNYPDLPFSKVDQEFEVLVAGKTRRFNDLTLFDKQGKPVCVFELKPPENHVERVIENIYGRTCNISWYSYKRMKELFSQGHLFAWHIFQESNKLLTATEIDIVDQLGIPSPYSTAREDISSLIAILSSIKKELNLCRKNAVYEAGLIYVCLRNISLSASSFLSEKLDFSRYSPFNLPDASCQFPLSRRDYEILVQARHSSMRGGTPPKLNIYDVLDEQDAALKWAQVIGNLAGGV